MDKNDKLKRYIAQTKKYVVAETEFHESSKYFKLFYVISGKFQLHVDNKISICSTNDIVVINKKQPYKIIYEETRYPLEIMTVGLLPEYIEQLSDENCDLSSCFIDSSNNKIYCIKSGSEICMLTKSLIKRILSIEKVRGFGFELFEKSTVVMLLVLVNKAYLEYKSDKKTVNKKNILIDDIFVYIIEHINQEITLDMLEQQFYVSKFHISREFKKHTGTTIHKYIVKRRLNYCKELIEKGMPIIEVYKRCGFGGYSHLFRAFKKEFNITPKDYYRTIKNQM